MCFVNYSESCPNCSGTIDVCNHGIGSETGRVNGQWSCSKCFKEYKEKTLKDSSNFDTEDKYTSYRIVMSKLNELEIKTDISEAMKFCFDYAYYLGNKDKSNLL